MERNTEKNQIQGLQEKVLCKQQEEILLILLEINLQPLKPDLVSEMYKTKIDTKTLNNTLLNITKILDANGDTYNDSLPIAINPIRFTYEDEEKQKTFKTENKIDENATAEETFYKLKEKYEIENSDETEVRKIMGLRYEIALQGYSSTKTVKLADNISSLSVNQLNDGKETNSLELPNFSRANT